MSGFSNGGGGLKYTCVDIHPDTLHGGHTNGDGKLFYLVEARCGSLSAQGRELVCAVCSKQWEI